jgi:hypothetical protein
MKRGGSRRESKSSVSLKSSASPHGSASSIDTSDFLREAHLFIFNDLFLFCRPSKAIGKKGLVKSVVCFVV